jgi:hypothetical protein
MKIEKIQLRGNNSVCAEEFQLLRGRAPAQIRGNDVFHFYYNRLRFTRSRSLLLFKNLSSQNMTNFKFISQLLRLGCGIVKPV